MKKNNNLYFIICLAVLALLAIFCFTKFGKGKKDVENFTGLAAGSSTNAGMFLNDSYDMLDGADDEIPAPNFADLVQQEDYTKDYIESPKDNYKENLRPMERLHRIQGEQLMPRVSTNVTPFNVDVANPTSHKYMVNTPRATSALKSKYKDYSLSSFIRGDIPIAYYPNVPLVAKTVQGRDDLRLDGLFTPYFTSLYNKYTGKEYKNLVQKVAGAGQASGYGGASGGVIMDHY